MKHGTLSIGRSLAAALSLLLAPSLNALAEPIAVFSFQDASCGTWTRSSRDNAQREPYLHWVRGFISGYNAGNSERTVTLEAMPNQDTLALYLDKHCRENPLDSFFIAAFSLAKEISRPISKRKQ